MSADTHRHPSDEIALINRLSAAALDPESASAHDANLASLLAGELSAHAGASKLTARLSADNVGNRAGALAELLTGVLLRELGLVIEREPQIDGQTPDYLVRSTEPAVLVEVTAVLPAHTDQQQDEMLARLDEELVVGLPREWALIVHYEHVPPQASAIAANEWLRRVLSDAHTRGIRRLEDTFEDASLILNITAFHVPGKKTYLGARMEPLTVPDSVSGQLGAVIEKTATYRDLAESNHLAYVVAVADFGKFPADAHDLEDLWLGTLRARFTLDGSGQLVGVEARRDAHGWLPRWEADDPDLRRQSQPSAVVVFRVWGTEQGHDLKARLLVNPVAQVPVPAALTGALCSLMPARSGNRYAFSWTRSDDRVARV